jgi:hypothetical protein
MALFLGVILLTYAQDDFHHGGLDLSKYHISHLQTHMNPSSDMFDGIKVERIIGILQSNLRQWGFIEGQLMEPDVNLKMPEIMIPLRHLTTTLEVLGNIFYVKGEVCEARCFLERACPLLELLPFEESTTYHSASTDCYGVLKEIYYSLYSAASAALHMEGDNITANFHKLADDDGASCDGDPDECTNNNTDTTPGDMITSMGLYKPCTCPSNDEVGATTSLDYIGFDLPHQLESLRSPYEHIRTKSTHRIPEIDFSSFEIIGRTVDSSSGLEHHQEGHSHQQPGDGMNTSKDENDGTTTSAGDGEDSPLENLLKDLPSSGLSSVMWKMLLDFVREDDYGRREILHLSRQHYADLHSSVEEFNTEAVVTRLATADAYLAIMHKAAHEGFGFINRELAEYGYPATEGLSHNSVLQDDFVSIHGELSPGENARLVVLAAFDRALTEENVVRDPQRQRKLDRIRKKQEAAAAAAAAASSTTATTANKGPTNPFPDESQDANKYSDATGDENISNTVVFIFITAISVTLYISFVESNKRRLREVKQVRSQPRNINDYFEALCERVYQWMESGVSSGSAVPTTSSASNTPAAERKDASLKKKSKKVKKEPKSNVARSSQEATEKSTDENESEDESESDDEIELRVYESTDFKKRTSDSQAYEENPEELDNFFNDDDNEGFRDVKSSERIGIEPQEPPLTQDVADVAAVEAAEKRAEIEAEKAKKKIARKEKDRLWKKEQKEKKALARDAGAASTSMPGKANDNNVATENHLGGLFGNTNVMDPTFNTDFSFSMLGGDMNWSGVNGVVGENRPKEESATFSFNDAPLQGLMAPSDSEADSGNFAPSFGLPSFPLFSSSLLGDDARHADSAGGLPGPPVSYDGPAALSAPPGLSKPLDADPFASMPQPKISSFPGNLELPPLSDMGKINPYTDPVVGYDVLDRPNYSSLLSGSPREGPPAGGVTNSNNNSSNSNSNNDKSVTQPNSDKVTLEFSCRCVFLSASSIQAIKVSSPALAEPFMMECMSNDESLFVGSIEISRAWVTFQYKYLVENQLGIVWEEERQNRIVFLKSDGATIPIKDTIQSGCIKES